MIAASIQHLLRLSNVKSTYPCMVSFVYLVYLVCLFFTAPDHSPSKIRQQKRYLASDL